MDGVLLGVSDGVLLGVGDGIRLGVCDGVLLEVGEGVLLGFWDTAGLGSGVSVLCPTVPLAASGFVAHEQISAAMNSTSKTSRHVL
jgi:hypothetical protein